MKTWILAVLCVALLAVSSFAQQKKRRRRRLDPAELKTVLPTNYFFDGLVASVQVRNAGAIRFDNGKLLIVAFVDNSGYSSDIQSKYQGLFITETKVSIGNQELLPGQYGFGFTKEGNFVVLDVAFNEMLSTSYEIDDQVKRPVPLKVVSADDGYRLYAGKKYVLIKSK